MSIEHTLQRAMSALAKHGFVCENFAGSNNCFDIIAKKGGSRIILKAYDNIDSIRKEQGEELKKLAGLLGAACVIIGEKTKVFPLEDSTVYYRYDVPAVTIATFEGLLGHKSPLARYFKGKSIVEMDYDALKKKREKLELSLSDLAQKVGVAPESMYRFEKGASTSLDTALRLEKELKESLIRSMDIFEKQLEIRMQSEDPDDELLEKMRELGIKMALFKHSPFKAYTDSDEGMFIGTGKGKFDIPKKAVELKKTSTVIDKDSVIITKEYKYSSSSGVPIISEEELDSVSRARDLKKMIREREENKR